MIQIFVKVEVEELFVSKIILSILHVPVASRQKERKEGGEILFKGCTMAQKQAGIVSALQILISLYTIPINKKFPIYIR